MGGTLGAAGHPAARREAYVGFGDPQRFGAPPFLLVESGEALVGVGADDVFGDAGFVKPDGSFDVAAPFGFLGF